VGYTLIRADEREFVPVGDEGARGIVRLSDALRHSRANVWRYAPGARGRRHLESVQEEVFVVLEGSPTALLGDPPERVRLPRGSVVLLEPGTAVQIANDGGEDAVVLIVGAPPEPGKAEYLPDAE
jgi:mannose-6-phosphate isomerase-like protein (cupin superfamily)